MTARRIAYGLEAAVWGLLVAAHLLVHVEHPGLEARWPQAMAVVRDAAAVGQAGLLLAWMILGPGRWPARTVGIMALWVLVQSEPFAFARRSSWNGPVLILETAAGVLFLALAAARWRGYKVERMTAEPAVALRFSLFRLMAVVLAAAVLVRVAQWLHERSAVAETLARVVAFTGAGVVLALVALLSLLAVLRPGAPWFRLVCLAAAGPALPCALPYVAGGLMPFWSLVGLVTVEGAITAASLAVVRSCGYRLVQGDEKHGA